MYVYFICSLSVQSPPNEFVCSIWISRLVPGPDVQVQPHPLHRPRVNITIKYAIKVIHHSTINYALLYLLSLVLLFAGKHKEN